MLCIKSSHLFEPEERGRKESCMKMSAQCWARAVNPGVYGQGLSAVLQTPRAPGQPTQGPEGRQIN